MQATGVFGDPRDESDLRAPHARNMIHRPLDSRDLGEGLTDLIDWLVGYWERAGRGKLLVEE